MRSAFVLAEKKYADKIAEETLKAQEIIAAFNELKQMEFLSNMLKGDISDEEKERVKEAFELSIEEYDASHLSTPISELTNGNTNLGQNDRKKAADGTIPDYGTNVNGFLNNFFGDGGVAGDVSYYYDNNAIAAGHCGILKRDSKQLLSSTMPNKVMKEDGICWYNRDTYRKLINYRLEEGNVTLRQIRAKGNNSGINDTIQNTYNDAKPYKYNLLNFDRRNLAAGTYCNQIPWYVWDKHGVNIANEYYETTELACRSYQATRTVRIFCWTVTVSYTAYEFYWKTVGHYKEFPIIFGDSILNDDDTYEVNRTATISRGNSY